MRNKGKQFSLYTFGKQHDGGYCGVTERVAAIYNCSPRLLPPIGNQENTSHNSH